MSTLAKRLIEARKDSGMTQKQLADASGLKNQSTIGMLESGERKSSSYIPRIAQALGVNSLWLSDGIGPKSSAADDKRTSPESSNVGSSARPVLFWEHESDLPEDQYVYIPRLTVEASCGDGRVVWHVEEKGQRNAFRRSWADRLGINPEKCATIVASGDSMEERICDGDSLVIDHTQTSISDGKVYAIAYENEVFVKRLFKRLGGGIRIVSDNTDKTRYPDWDVAPEQLEHLQIIGRVVAISGGM